MNEEEGERSTFDAPPLFALPNHNLNPNFSFSLLVIRFMETSPLLGRVHSVETFGSVDGPGIRFLIFLKGCSMRCRYCHNPDTWDPETDDLRTADELLTQAMRYRSYWGREGGITVSGGESERYTHMPRHVGATLHTSGTVLLKVCRADEVH